ncbi:hypothetical protein CLD22_14575 [Rubrivivax gelatinosus]|nr:hypothetical protein [Rubrivivax gelatinosus]
MRCEGRPAPTIPLHAANRFRHLVTMSPPALPLSTFLRPAAALAWALVVAGCQSLPSPPAGGEPPGSAGTAPVPASPPAAPPPAPPRPDAEIRQLLDSARVLLDQGQEDAALRELQQVLASDGQNRVALSLLRQVREDPGALYGRESFPYRVAPGDSLGSIAQRFMADRDQFYGLARYNGIRVPGQIAAGQTIKVPGKMPRGGVSPPPVAAPVATPVAPPASAPAAVPSASASASAARAPDPAAEQARIENEKRAAVARRSRDARAAMARQDVCGAIKAWDEVLRLDPGNHAAALERERALELKRRLPSAKC